MRKLLFFIFFIFLFKGSFTQNVGIGIKGFLTHDDKKTFSFFPEKYSYQFFDGIKYISTIIKVNENFIESDLLKYNCKIGSRIGKILTVYIPTEKVRGIIGINGIEDIEISHKVSGPKLIKATNDISADLVWNGFELPQGYTGKNVIIGITDWGFDYTHPMFYDTTLTNYRIIAAWDQFRNQGPSPSGYLYGTVFEGKQSLISSQCDTSNIYKYAYHGTHVAGIAAGGGASTNYRGVASGSELLFATFLIDEASVLDAYSWMRGVALAEEKRLVINGSWGLYNIGLLDGTSLFDQAIDSMSINDNIVFVTSGGNNGDVDFHIKANFTNHDTITTGIGFDFQNPTENYWGQTITLSGDSTDRFSARLEFYDYQFQLIHSTSWVNTYSNDFLSDTLLLIGSDSIIYRANSISSTPISNRPIQEWEVRLSNYQLNQYFVILSVTSPNGNVHAWNVASLSTGVGNWGLDFKKYRNFDIVSDNKYSISEPAVCNSTIAVGAYYPQLRGSSSGGARAGFSSIGPTIDGRIKPEISAPGVNITSSISSFSTTDFSDYNLVSFEGRDYPFAPLSGTSMSSPIITGIVALMLEANPNLNSNQIKNIIQQTARYDNYTTSNIPNNNWGWGKASALNAVKRAVELIGLDNEIEVDSKIILYPNPIKNELNILTNEKIKNIQIYDVYGRKLIDKDQSFSSIDVTSLSDGVYIISICLENKCMKYKVLKK